jgi:hypothetical protein
VETVSAPVREAGQTGVEQDTVDGLGQGAVNTNNGLEATRQQIEGRYQSRISVSPYSPAWGLVACRASVSSNGTLSYFHPEVAGHGAGVSPG